MCEESACNAGDLGSVPGLGRLPGEGNGNPLQYSCWRIPWTEEPGRLHTVHRVTKSWIRLKQLGTQGLFLLENAGFSLPRWLHEFRLSSLKHQVAAEDKSLGCSLLPQVGCAEIPQFTPWYKIEEANGLRLPLLLAVSKKPRFNIPRMMLMPLWSGFSYFSNMYAEGIDPPFSTAPPPPTIHIDTVTHTHT